jgi:hypothetical protein
MQRQPANSCSSPHSPVQGSSFIQFGGAPDEDNEMYLDVRLGQDQLVSPDTRLDAIVDLIGNAPQDIIRLIDEVRRFRDTTR